AADRPALPAVAAVGHRVVHAAEAFSGSVRIDPAVMQALEECSDLAPLHNPPNLAGIRACLEALPGLPQVAVFDNAVHHTLPPEAYLYALPRDCYETGRVRRYGFHGVAFRSMRETVERLTGQPATAQRIVFLMLGSGCTANALRYGESIAVSTGFTPLEGLLQSTRCGDLDPGVVLELLRRGHSAAELNTLFNRQSGLLGVSGLSPDMRDLEAAGTPAAEAALDLFVHRLVKYVGAYTADLGGLDTLAFGGGIGQHAPEVRERLCRQLRHLGLELDPAANAALPRGASALLQTAASRVQVAVCAVDEELVIARDTYALVSSS
ncbi:MAG: acetate/propionate family kinase, partial [Fimbriimonadaceae bacterium]|nr:acetate/propionate family kinase [Fimbriimonadaceae bacterium]